MYFDDVVQERDNDGSKTSQYKEHEKQHSVLVYDLAEKVSGRKRVRQSLFVEWQSRKYIGDNVDAVVLLRYICCIRSQED